MAGAISDRYSASLNFVISFLEASLIRALSSCSVVGGGGTLSRNLTQRNLSVSDQAICRGIGPQRAIQ